MYTNTSVTVQQYRGMLSSMPVKDIKLYASNLGIKCPSMKKDDLVGWLSGALYQKSMGSDPMKKMGYKIDMSRVFGVSVSKPYGTGDTEWLQSIRDHGVVSVPIPNFDHNHYKKEFWSWLTMCNPEVTENNRSSWSLDLVPPNTRGIFKNYIGHQEWIWKARESCHSIFANIWGTKDLLCSFDGASVIFPEKQSIVTPLIPQGIPSSGLLNLGSSSPSTGSLYGIVPSIPQTTTSVNAPTKFKNSPGTFSNVSSNINTFKNWFHYDQGRFSHDLCSIQGIVHLTDSMDDDGGFCFIENSHKLHKAYSDSHPSWGYKWEVIDVDDKVFEGCRLIKPRVKAGELFLFDSRLAHCFIPSRSNNHRMVIYVCMMPRSGATPKEIEKRQKLYVENSMTGHWCYGPWFDKTDAPYTPGRAQIKPPPFFPPREGLSPLRLSMIGV